MKKNLPVLLTGVIVGIAALVLTAFGNPANMGFCIACFLRDIAGALKLHSAGIVQYVFLGCPLRMVIRIGGGDLNAVVGLVGFIAGIFVGTIALKKGFSLKRNYAEPCIDGAWMPVLMVILLVLAGLAPALFAQSTEGPGSMHAPIILALAAGIVVGILAQRSRFCMAGGIRDTIMFNQWNLTLGFVAVIATVLVGNLILGKFNLGFADQPVAHNDGIMNFLGMGIVGCGCPLRQLILTGEGNSDSAVTVTGFVFGAALAHNFGTASSAKGPGANGVVAVIACYAVLLIVTLANVKASKE